MSLSKVLHVPQFLCVDQINKITEVSLTANQERAEMERKRLVWKVKGSPPEPKVWRGGAVNPENLIVELAPMEIRTFVISFRA